MNRSLNPNPPGTRGLPTRKRTARRTLQRRRGAAVVEFAMVVPLLSLLLLGLFEFGRVIMIQQVLTNAAREAAREASLIATTDNETVKNAAWRFTDAAKLPRGSVQFGPDENWVTDDPITVEVSVPIEAVSWLSSTWFPSGYEISASATMRKEGFN